MLKLTYPFTSAYFTSIQYNKIESKIIPYAIAKIGFNRTLPLALSCDSYQYGGVGLRKLETKALIKNILAI